MVCSLTLGSRHNSGTAPSLSVAFVNRGDQTGGQCDPEEPFEQIEYCKGVLHQGFESHLVFSGGEEQSSERCNF